MTERIAASPSRALAAALQKGRCWPGERCDRDMSTTANGEADAASDAAPRATRCPTCCTFIAPARSTRPRRAAARSSNAIPDGARPGIAWRASPSSADTWPPPRSTPSARSPRWRIRRRRTTTSRCCCSGAATLDGALDALPPRDRARDCGTRCCTATLAACCAAWASCRRARTSSRARWRSTTRSRTRTATSASRWRCRDRSPPRWRTAAAPSRCNPTGTWRIAICSSA